MKKTDREDSEQLSNEQSEEMDAIKAYDAAKAENDDVIPFEQAIKEIEVKRNAP